MLDLRECLLPDADNLPSVVYLSAVQTPKPSNDGHFMFWLCLPEIQVTTADTLSF